MLNDGVGLESLAGQYDYKEEYDEQRIHHLHKIVPLTVVQLSQDQHQPEAGKDGGEEGVIHYHHIEADSGNYVANQLPINSQTSIIHKDVNGLARPQDVIANKLPVQDLGNSVPGSPVKVVGLQLVPHEDQQHGLEITVPAQVADVPEIQHHNKNRQVSIVNLTSLLLVNCVQEENAEGLIMLNSLLISGNQMELGVAAEGSPEAGAKVETTTTGSNAPLDTLGSVYAAQFTPEATDKIEVADEVHQEDDEETGELKLADPNSQGDVHGEDSQVLQIPVPQAHRVHIKFLDTIGLTLKKLVTSWN